MEFDKYGVYLSFTKGTVFFASTTSYADFKRVVKSIYLGDSIFSSVICIIMFCSFKFKFGAKLQYNDLEFIRKNIEKYGQGDFLGREVVVAIISANKRFKIITKVCGNFYSYNLVKPSFKLDWSFNDMNSRQFLATWPCILNVNVLNVSTAIFSEEYFDGFALSRIRSGSKKSYIKSLIIAEWNRVAADLSSERVEVLEYMKYINVSAQLKYKNIIRSKFLDLYIQKQIENFFLMVDRRLDDGNLCDMVIDVTYSHGDLKEGNILINREFSRFVIIDWESFGKRSQEFDEFHLFYGLRHKGIRAEFNRLRDDLNKNGRLSYFYLFVLEEAIWRLDEIEQSNGYVNPGNLGFWRTLEYIF